MSTRVHRGRSLPVPERYEERIHLPATPAITPKTRTVVPSAFYKGTGESLNQYEETTSELAQRIAEM